MVLNIWTKKKENGSLLYGVERGLIFFLLQYGLHTTRCFVETTRFHNLNAKVLGKNIEKMLVVSNCLLDDIKTQMDVFKEDFCWFSNA